MMVADNVPVQLVSFLNTKAPYYGGCHEISKVRWDCSISSLPERVGSTTMYKTKFYHVYIKNGKITKVYTERRMVG